MHSPGCPRSGGGGASNPRRRIYEIRPVRDSKGSASAAEHPRSLEIWKEPGSEITVVATSLEGDESYPAELGHDYVRLETDRPEWIRGAPEDAHGISMDLPMECSYAPLEGRIPGILDALAPVVSADRKAGMWIQAVYADLGPEISGDAAEAYSELARLPGGGLDADAAEKLAPYGSPGPAGALAGLTVMGAVQSPDAVLDVGSMAEALGGIRLGGDALSAWPCPLKSVLPWLESRDFSFGTADHVIDAVAAARRDPGHGDESRVKIPFLAATPAELRHLVQVPAA